MSGRCSGLSGSSYDSDLAGRCLSETTADEVSDEADIYSSSDSSPDNDETENEEDLSVGEHSDDATL